MTTAYAADLNLWAQQTAGLLREKRWNEIDLEHLAEELEDLSKSEKRAIASQLARLLLYLLKWQYQPQRRSDSWLDSISDARLQIELAIQDSPSLKNHPEAVLEPSYAIARRNAAKQTGLPLAVFPASCLYPLPQILAEEWLPD